MAPSADRTRAPRRIAAAALVRALVVALAAITISACATWPGAGTGAAGGDATASEGSKRLEQARARYDDGAYAEAASLLQGSAEIWSDTPEVRIQAYKLLAFSQCALNRRTACQETFDALLRLSPDYTLTAAEASHPIWGPTFQRARRQAERRDAAAPAAPARR